MYEKIEFEVLGRPDRSAGNGQRSENIRVSVGMNGSGAFYLAMTLPPSVMKEARIQIGDRAKVSVSKDRTILCVERVPKNGYAVSPTGNFSKEARQGLVGKYARCVIKCPAQSWMRDKWPQSISVEPKDFIVEGSCVYVSLS